MDLLNLLYPQTPHPIVNARVIHFDTTPMSERTDREGELEDRRNMKDFRISRVRKALAGGHWRQFSQIERVTGMHHIQLQATLRTMMQRNMVEVHESNNGNKWRLK